MLQFLILAYFTINLSGQPIIAIIFNANCITTDRVEYFRDVDKGYVEDHLFFYIFCKVVLL